MDKNYFIFTQNGTLFPVKEYDFEGKKTLFNLVQNECYSKKILNVRKRRETEEVLKELGFEWDPLACPGYMRYKTTAVMMQEMMEKKYWEVVERFCEDNDIPLYKVSAGELFDSRHPYFQKQTEVIRQEQMYGTDLYDVLSSDGPQLLRYIACATKLMITKEINLKMKDLPLAFFEISKSYRHEKEEDLCLCSRIRAFRMVDTHILSKTFEDGLNMLLAAHKYSLTLLRELYSSCDLLCNISETTFNRYKDFLVKFPQTLGRDVLLQIIPDHISHGNDVNIDLEYKISDYSGQPLELATLQLDDGTSNFAYGVSARDENGKIHGVATMHTVFLGSLDRAIYACVDSSLKKKKKNSTFLPLPKWINPINMRFMTSFPMTKDFQHNLLKLEKMLGSIDVDDRNMSITQKFESKDIKFIPFFTVVEKNGTNYLFELLDFNRTTLLKTNVLSELERFCNEKIDIDKTKKRCFPFLKSKRLF